MLSLRKMLCLLMKKHLQLRRLLLRKHLLLRLRHQLKSNLSN